VFIKVLNFLAGYVKVEVTGFSVERFISQCVSRGLILWDLERQGGKFLMTLSKADFQKARELAEKTSTRVTPLSVHGFPVFAAKIKKRPLLPLGGLAFIIGMVVLTSFIWQIDVEGTERIDATEMLTFLESHGFSVGSSRRGVAYREVEGLLMLEFADIAWVSLSITGTRALIQVNETIDHAPLLRQFDAEDIVASKDGIIVHMATSAGTPLFRPGDVVAKGETIVSGRLAIETAEEGLLATQYIQASAEVWARVYYTMNFSIPLTYSEKSFTGQRSRVYSATVGGQDFTLPSRPHGFAYYQTIENRHNASLGRDLPMPLGVTVTIHHELTRHMRTRTPEAAQELGQELAARRIMEEMGESPDIIEKQINFTQNHRVLEVEVFLVAIERIDQTKELIPEEQDEPETTPEPFAMR